MNTKEMILEEALKQFSEKGYDGTSMSDIAAPLGISKAALYKHYKSKQEIFDKIIEESEIKYKNLLEKLSVHYIDNNKKLSKKEGSWNKGNESQWNQIIMMKLQKNKRRKVCSNCLSDKA